MLGWALAFLLIAIVAGVLGFGGIAGAAAGMRKTAAGNQALYGFSVDVVQPDEPAVCGQASRRGQADAGGGAGDECGLHDG